MAKADIIENYYLACWVRIRLRVHFRSIFPHLRREIPHFVKDGRKKNIKTQIKGV